MSQQIAHNIDSKSRTEDIRISDNVDFTAMLLSAPVLRGLQKTGFKKPSPIQLKAIPMGRCGFDLVIKAKSGTGKTAVFGIVGLEMVDVESDALQVLILAPTREIAVQIQQVLLTIGVELEGLKVEYFIGGTPIEEDVNKLRGCHIAVGAPGRVKHLVKKNAMRLDTVRLFVLDEADKLMQHSYQTDINYIYNKLGPRRQLIASSATYPDALGDFLTKYMASPVHVSPDSEVPVLLGIKQFAAVVDAHHNVIQQMSIKTAELVRIFRTISFAQCIVFSNYQTRAESLSNNLTRLGWPAAYISAAQPQSARLAAVHSLQEFRCRILSTTDLTARGIDAANVDLVVNYEVPGDVETYLHRMGRAGRYGSHGICVTIAADGTELEKLQRIIGRIGDGGLSIARYPRTEDLPANVWECDVRDFAQLTARPTDPESICSPMQGLTVAANVDQIARILANDTDDADRMGDFVGTVLSDLNKQQDLRKTELGHRFGGLDSGSLFESLAKSLCAGNEQNAQGSDAMQQQCGGESKREKRTAKKCRSKRTKNIQQCTTDQNETNRPNEQFENEAKMFQENSILNKNLALYKLTALLVDEQQTVNEDCVTSIGDLLSILQQEEETDKTDIDLPAALSDMLHPKQHLKWELNQEPAVAAAEEKGKTINCGCSENIFSQAYAFAVSQDGEDWRNALCEKHRKTVDNCEEEGMKEDYCEDEAGYVSEWEPIYNVEGDEQEYVVNAEYDKEDSVNAGELDDYLFVKAYDYALNSETEDPPQSEEICGASGYVSGCSYKNFSFKNRNKRKHTDYERKMVDCMKDGTYRDNDYASHYDYYDNILAQSVPYFSDVPSFERFFKRWQENVYAIRNYVQEDVYTKEMLRRSK